MQYDSQPTRGCRGELASRGLETTGRQSRNQKQQTLTAEYTEDAEDGMRAHKESSRNGTILGYSTSRVVAGLGFTGR